MLCLECIGKRYLDQLRIAKECQLSTSGCKDKCPNYKQLFNIDPIRFDDPREG